MVDNCNMNVSGISSSTAIAGLMTTGQADGVPAQISMAVTKSIMDSQKQFGQALIQMIQSMPTPDGTGKIVNKSA